jgi:hypothetical protein
MVQLMNIIIIIIIITRMEDKWKPTQSVGLSRHCQPPLILLLLLFDFLGAWCLGLSSP